MNSEDYLFGHFKALNEHLKAVHPIVEEFCSKHGFRILDRQSVGRYPRIRFHRGTNPWLWYDLTLGLDNDGKRFEAFSPDLPYELGAGMTYEEGELRYSIAKFLFKDIPFTQVPAILAHELSAALPTLESWNIETAKTQGLCVKVGPKPS